MTKSEILDQMKQKYGISDKEADEMLAQGEDMKPKKCEIDDKDCLGCGS